MASVLNISNDHDELITCVLTELGGSFLFSLLTYVVIAITGAVTGANFDFDTITTPAILAIAAGTAIAWSIASVITAFISNSITEAVTTRQTSEKSEVFCAGHITPMVTFALCLLRQISPVVALIYTLAQFIGAAVAALVMLIVQANPMYRQLGVSYIGEGVPPGSAFLMEVILTFVFVLAMLVLKLLPVASASVPNDKLSYSQRTTLDKELAKGVKLKMQTKLDSEQRSAPHLFRAIVREQEGGKKSTALEPSLNYGNESALVKYFDLGDPAEVDCASTILQALDSDDKKSLGYNDFAKLYVISATKATDPAEAATATARLKATNDAVCSGVVIFITSVLGLGVSGGSVNTARSFGPAIFSGFGSLWSYQWIFWTGPYVGAAAATLFFKVLAPSDTKPPKA